MNLVKFVSRLTDVELQALVRDIPAIEYWRDETSAALVYRKLVAQCALAVAERKSRT
jgi:hypothetical protein